MQYLAVEKLQIKLGKYQSFMRMAVVSDGVGGGGSEFHTTTEKPP